MSGPQVIAPLLALAAVPWLERIIHRYGVKRLPASTYEQDEYKETWTWPSK